MHQAEPDLAEAASAELGRKVRGPQPAALDLLLQGADQLTHRVVVERDGLEREDLSRTKLRIHASCSSNSGSVEKSHATVASLSSLFPCLPVFPADRFGQAHYRCAMPGDRSSSSIRTTVRVDPPIRIRPASGVGRPRSTPGAARARLVGRRAGAARREVGSSPRRSSPTSRVLPDRWVTSLAALAHQVRLVWCGPEVEVEGILSAKTGGCPEDCHFCSQSSRFDSPVKATPFLDTEEVLRRRGRDPGRRCVGVLPGARRSGVPTSGRWPG